MRSMRGRTIKNEERNGRKRKSRFNAKKTSFIKKIYLWNGIKKRKTREREKKYVRRANG